VTSYRSIRMDLQIGYELGRVDNQRLPTLPFGVWAGRFLMWGRKNGEQCNCLQSEFLSRRNPDAIWAYCKHEGTTDQPRASDPAMRFCSQLQFRASALSAPGPRSGTPLGDHPRYPSRKSVSLMHSRKQYLDPARREVGDDSTVPTRMRFRQGYKGGGHIVVSSTLRA
jgi:hypothetical protein